MKNYDPEIHHRRSIRLKGYDYRRAGYYYVTICTVQKQCLLGDIRDGRMHLSAFGQIAAEAWQWLATHYSFVALDEWIMMPNHLHGIIVLTDDQRDDVIRRGGSRTAPTARSKHKPLGRLIGAFKTVSTKQINTLRQSPGESFWQRNYYEHIIREENRLNQIRHYIRTNPENWLQDSEHPKSSDPNHLT